MARPFRPEVSDDDEVPDYAKEVSSEVPSYAKEVTEDKAKPSLFSRAMDALKPAKSFKPTGAENFYKAVSGFLGTDKKPEQLDRSKRDKRPDGSDKGDGFLGVFKLPNGSVASEYSIADSEKLKDKKGNYIDYPSLVPTLTREEVQQTLDAAHKGTDVPDSVKAKAEAHALKRQQQGLPLFATPGEERTDLHPDLERVGSSPKKEEANVFSKAVSGLKSDEQRKDTNAVGFDQDKWTNKASKLPESWHGIPVRWPAAFLGSLAGTAAETLSAPENIAAMGAGAGMSRTLEHPADKVISNLTSLPKKEEPSIRQSREVPYRMGGSVQAPEDIPLPKETPKETPSTETPVKTLGGLVNPFLKTSVEVKAIERQPSNLPPEMVMPSEGEEYNKYNAIKTANEPSVRQASRYTPEDLASADVETKRLLSTEPPERIKGLREEASPEVPEYAKEIQPSIEESRTPGDYPLNDASKMSRESQGELNDFMQSATPAGEQSVEQLKAGMGDVPSVRQPRDFSLEGPQRFPGDEAFDLGDSQPLAKYSHNNPELGGRQYDIAEGSTVSEAETVKRGYKLPDSPTAEEAATEPRLSGTQQREKALAARAASPDKIVQMHGGLGGIGSGGELEPSTGPHAEVLDKLFNALNEAKGKVNEKAIINKSERARRFAAFAGVKEEGATGASKSLSKLKGEFDKVELGTSLGLKPQETDQLFTAVKKANITEGEKARGYTALFKLMNGESVPVRSELKILDDVFGNGFADKIINMHGGIGAIGLKLSKLANTMKSMQNAVSLAAPLRHGIGLVARKEFYPAFSDMFKFFGNKEFYDASMQAIEEHPNYMLGREGGLFISKPNSFLQSEEEFLNSYVGKVPLVRNVVGASQRAYMGFLNKLRFDTFNSMIEQAKSLGNESHKMIEDQIIPSQSTKAISKFINNATGRGDLGSLNKMTNELNLLLWSPRMIASRVTMLTNPKIFMDLPKGMRREGIKSLLGIAALGTGIDTLAAYGGAKVSTNILSTDYGKSRFGTKLIDPWGGFQQYVVGAARFLAGKTESNTPTSRLDIAGRFLANKESPAASLAHTLLTAKKFTGGGDFTSEYGQKTSVQGEIAKRFTPIFVQDLQELATSEPDWADNVGLSAVLGVASLTGMKQSYQTPQKGKLSLRKMSGLKP